MNPLGDYVQLPDPSGARLWFLVGVFTYMGALFLSYVYLLSPIFGYLGIVYRPDGFASVLVALFVAAVPAVWMPVRLKRPSQVIYLLLYLMVMIPTLLVGAFTGVLTLFRVVLFGAVFLVVFGGLRLLYEASPLDLPKLVETNTGFWLLFAALAGGLYGLLFAKYGVYTEIPSLGEVYAQREEFRQAIGGLGAYAFFWVAKAINPFFLAKGYVDRNPLLFGIGIGGQVLLFAMSGLRSVLFSFLLLGAMLVAMWRDGQYFGHWVVWGLAGLIGMSAAVDTYLGVTVTSSLFVRRLLIAPGLNMSFYLDFFSTNPHVFLGHSVLGWAVDYPYEARPAMVIGNAYYGHLDIPIDMSANANLWADAYANFGIPGIFLFTAVLAGLFWFADSVARGCPKTLSVLMLAYPAYMLVNTKLQTSLLTHGIGLVLVILYLLPRQTTSADRE